jgi:hypothetical protein
LEFAAINAIRPESQILIDLCKANKKLWEIIVLDQDKCHRMTLLSKIKSDDYPNGLALEYINKVKKDNKPSDVSAVIKLELELERLQLKGMRDFYNVLVGVVDKYKVMKTEHEICMLMARKNQNEMYA